VESTEKRSRDMDSIIGLPMYERGEKIYSPKYSITLTEATGIPEGLRVFVTGEIIFLFGFDEGQVSIIKKMLKIK
jgi:hypothetical protein